MPDREILIPDFPKFLLPEHSSGSDLLPTVVSLFPKAVTSALLQSASSSIVPFLRSLDASDDIL